MELLLLSNSTLPGKAWMEHAMPLIASQLNGRRSAVFIPFAGVTQTWDEYTAKTAAVFAPLGVTVTGIHSVADPIAAIENAELVIVGGGNTFQLLKESRERGLLAPIVDVVKRGALYIGWSAGANLACPTIRTTNDMPIVDPQGFDALGLFPLQINPHFTNALPEGHKGETREQREWRTPPLWGIGLTKVVNPSCLAFRIRFLCHMRLISLRCAALGLNAITRPSSSSSSPFTTIL